MSFVDAAMKQRVNISLKNNMNLIRNLCSLSVRGTQDKKFSHSITLVLCSILLDDRT